MTTASLHAPQHADPVRDTVTSVIMEVATEQSKKVAPLTDSLPLMESGLDSLCIAIVVARLDDQLDVDPFGGDDIDLPVTVGDFIRIYENALA